MSRPNEDISALTGLRGFATLWVVAYHFWEFLGFPRLQPAGFDASPLLDNAYFAVDIFFVLSGFLVARPFLRAALGQGPMPSYGGYLWRRVRRVIPAFWGNFLVLTALVWIATGVTPVGPIDALGHLGLLFWYTLPAGGVPFNPVWWTLPIEWWAYFLLPPLALALKRVPVWLWLVAVLGFVLWTRIGFVTHFFAGDQSFWWQAQDYRHLRARVDQFAIGLLAAWYFERGVSERAARRIGWIGLGLFALVFVHVGWFVPRWLHEAIRPWMYVHYTALAVSIAMVVLGIAAGWRGFARCFEGRIFMFAGTVSYSLYLWHYPVFQWLFRHAAWLDAAPAGLRGAIALIAAAIVTWIAYLAFERPFLTARAQGGKSGASIAQSSHA
ncbi:MAG TPA: acyltransferase [Patescibacteria group bacterium]|nr:acyltransferase [Patescibacteria group bacterium]